MSDIEQFYNGVRKHRPDLPEWNALDPQRQHLFLIGINHILMAIQ